MQENSPEVGNPQPPQNGVDDRFRPIRGQLASILLAAYGTQRMPISRQLPGANPDVIERYIESKRRENALHDRNVNMQYVLAIGHDCWPRILHWISLCGNAILNTDVIHRLSHHASPLHTPSIALATSAGCICQDCCASNPPTQAIGTCCEFEYITHCAIQWWGRLHGIRHAHPLRKSTIVCMTI